MMPLQGMRVLDLTIGSGFASMELADYGAEVIKVETPGSGDPLRSWPPFKNGANPHHAYRNRGKKSITLNIQTDAGKEIFKKLVSTADVVLENFTPGFMEASGLGYDVLSGLKSDLVYARLSAYGSTGPEADMPQSELLAQAKTGVMHVTGFAENPPTRIGFSIAEHYAASFLSTSICMAVYHARETGEGQRVETSLLGSIASVTEDKILTFGATGEDPMRTGNAHPLINPYDIIKCQDGYVALGCSSDEQWLKFCDVFGHPEWKTDEKYNSNKVRGHNYFGDLRVKIEELFSTLSMRVIADTCDAILIPGTLCSTTAEAVDEPQLLARNMLVTVEDKQLGSFTMPGKPVKFSNETEAPIMPAPLLGEHNDAIYGALNYGVEELNRLHQDGVI